jgi:hypothetical protein
MFPQKIITELGTFAIPIFDEGTVTVKDYLTFV